MSRSLRAVGVVLLLPLGLTMYAVCAAAWVGLWGAANLGYGAHNDSLPAVARGVSGMARSAGIISAPMSAWGAVLGPAPGAQTLHAWGDSLKTVSAAGLSLAPALPDALGENGPRRYMIAALNDAELFGSGGAPLDLAMVEVDQGQLSIPLSGSAGGKFNPGNVPYAWERIGGLPWYRPGKEYPFANSNYHPNFPYSGANMMSAWEALGEPSVDGVVTVDMFAVAQMLRAVGPLESGEYGTVTADNVIRKVLVDSYRRFPEGVPGAQEHRRAMNDQLRSDLIAHIWHPRSAIRAARGLWGTIPGRHLQALMTDPRMQASVRAIGAQASLQTAPGDIVGVFLQSGVSKLAVFQERKIDHQVTIFPDGSARIHQEVTFGNEVPDGLAGDPTSYRGYTALVFRQRVAFRIPEQATETSVRVTSGRALVPTGRDGPYPDDTGAKVLWQGQDIPPQQARTTIVEYELPKGTFGGPEDIRYTLTANPQAVALPVPLSVKVNFQGRQPLPESDSNWRLSERDAVWDGTLDRTITLHLRAS